MKAIVAAIGTLALTATIAQAAPARVSNHFAYGHAAEQTNRAAGSHWKDQDPTSDRIPNLGAGTSRSSDANQG